MKGNNNPKKHHVIPNFLLRNFAIDPSKKSKQVWLYRNDAEIPIKVNTKDVFAQNNFYTFPGGDTFLEGMLSKSEAIYAQAVAETLNKEQLENKHLPILLEFIHNLNCRGHAFRIEAHHLIGVMMNFLGKEFEDNPEGIIKNCARTSFPENERAMAQKQTYVLAGQIRYPLLHVNTVQMLETDFRKMIEQLGPDLLRRGLSEIKFMFSQYLNEEYFAKIIEKAQLEGLEKALSKLINIELLTSFEWSLMKSSEERFLLGDTGPIGFSETDNGWRYLPFIEGKDLRFVILPLSPKIALIGSHPTAHRTPPTIEEINKGIATTSLSSFISSDTHETLEQLCNQIGVNSHSSSTEMFREWGLPKEEKLYQSSESPCEATINLTFEKNCSLKQTDRANFIALSKTFEQCDKSLMLAEPFSVECTFTDNIHETLKFLEDNIANITDQSNSVKAEEIWIHVVNTEPQSRFKNHIIINTTHYNRADEKGKTEFLFKYFQQLFRLATDTYIREQKSDAKNEHFGIFKQTATEMQKGRLPTKLSLDVFQEVAQVRYLNSNEKDDNHVQNLIINHLENHISFCLDELINSFFPHIKAYRETGNKLDELARESEKIIAQIGVSLANYFAITTPDQRGEFFSRLKQVYMFRFTIEDEWKSISEFCDENSQEAKIGLMHCLERILARCGVYWYYNVDGQGQNDLIVGMSSYELLCDAKKNLPGMK